MAEDYEYSLMAGRAYLSTRAKINWFPVPDGWNEAINYRRNLDNGFEATYFQRDNEIVIAYAGTAEGVDWDDNGALALGVGSGQLDEAAAYYMEIRQANPDTEITLTGHYG